MQNPGYKPAQGEQKLLSPNDALIILERRFWLCQQSLFANWGHLRICFCIYNGFVNDFIVYDQLRCSKKQTLAAS